MRRKLTIPLLARDSSRNITTTVNTTDFSGAQVEVLKPGAPVISGSSSAGGGAAASISVAHVGALKTNDTLYFLQSGLPLTVNTLTVTGIDPAAPSVDVTVGGPAVTWSAGDRLVLVNGIAGHRVLLYRDDSGVTTVTNPVAASNASGHVDLFCDLDLVDVYVSGTGLTAQYLASVETGSPRQYINVRDFGAVGDGSTNDFVAINAAIIAADEVGASIPKSVYFPSGTYICNTAISLGTTSGLELYGDGATSIIRSPTTSGFVAFTVNAVNTVIRDLHFQGTVTTEPAAANECIRVSGTDCVIERCVFSGTSATAGYNVQIRVMVGGLRTRIVNNKFERCIGTNASYGYGVIVQDAATDCIIKGNESVFYSAGTQGRHHVYISAGCLNNIVANNRLQYGTSDQIVLDSGSTPGGAAVTGNVISGNVLTGQATSAILTNAGIHLANNCQRNSVIGNVIIGAFRHGIHLEGGGGGGADVPDQNIVDGNYIYQAQRTGILVNGASRTSVTKNHINDCSQETVGTYYGISVSDNTSAQGDSNLVEGNYVFGSRHFYAIRINAGPQNNVVGTNFLELPASGTARFANDSDETNKLVSIITIPATTFTTTTGTGDFTMIAATLSKFAVRWSSGTTTMTNQVLRVKAWGTITGTAGTKDVRLKLNGQTLITASGVGADVGDWVLEAEIMPTAQTTANVHATVIGITVTTAIEIQDAVAATGLDFHADQTLAVTGQCSNGGDTITPKGWCVQYNGAF